MPQKASEKTTKRLHILLAEDNRVNQLVAARMLEKMGHSVSVADDGKEALSAFESDSFDLVLMDVQMPRMDGFEATKAIRERERHTGGHVPIVALTAHATGEDRDECVARGMDGYLTKPINRRRLLDLIECIATAPCAQCFDSPPREESVEMPLSLDKDSIPENLTGSTTAFLRVCERMMDRLREAVSGNDRRNFRRRTRALKGALSTLGTSKTGPSLEWLEVIEGSSSREEAESALSHLESSLKDLGDWPATRDPHE